MKHDCNEKPAALLIGRARFVIAGAACVFALATPNAWAQSSGSSSSNSCGSSGGSTSGGSSSSSSSASSSPCAFDAKGLQSTVVSAATLAVPLAISNALSGALSGRTVGGVTRASLSPKDETGKAAAAGGEKWNAWAAYGRTNVGYSFAPLQSNGDVTLALLGVDYTFGGNVLAGVAASWDKTDIDTIFNAGKLTSRGYMVAPYLAWQINRSWLFDTSVGWGRSKLSQVDNSGGVPVAGTPTDDRLFGSLSLSYSRAFDKVLLTGKGSYLHAEDKIDAFTLSNGTVIPSSTTRLSQVRFGGQAAYSGAGVMPYVGLYYIRDTERADQPPVGGAVAANDNDAWQIAVGLNIVSKGALYGGIQFSSDRGRSEVKNNQFLVNIGVRF